MLIKSCLDCDFHKTKKGEEDQISYCQRENCYAQYSKCVVKKALLKFLEQPHEANGYDERPGPSRSPEIV